MTEKQNSALWPGLRVVLAFGLFALGLSGFAQGPGGAVTNSSEPVGRRDAGRTVRQLRGPSRVCMGPRARTALQVTQDSFKGSIVDGKNTGTVMDLSLMMRSSGACDRTLGSFCSLRRSKMRTDNGWSSFRRCCRLSTGEVSIAVQQVNLAAYGLSFPGLNPIVGPFQVVDFRARI